MFSNQFTKHDLFLANEIASRLKAWSINAGSTAARSVHSRTHFVLDATLVLDPSLHARSHRRGIFATREEFHCKLRFTSVYDDGEKQVFGVGLHFVGEEDDEPLGFGISYVSFDRFPLGREQDIRDVVRGLTWTSFTWFNLILVFFLFLFKCKLGRLYRAWNLPRKHGSLFSPNYHSCTTYQWGLTYHAKFSLVPSTYTDMYVERDSPEYFYREAIARQKCCIDPESDDLYSVFNFNIQIRSSDYRDDPDEIWHDVETVTLGWIKARRNQPAAELDWGRFDNAFLMDPVFLRKHAPIGVLNRIRWLVYEEMIQYRKARVLSY